MDTVRKLKDIKKVLMSGNGYIRIDSCVKDMLKVYDYTKGDIVSGIMKGLIIKIQMVVSNNENILLPSFIVEGENTKGELIYIEIVEEGKHTFRIDSVTSSMKKQLIV